MDEGWMSHGVPSTTAPVANLSLLRQTRASGSFTLVIIFNTSHPDGLIPLVPNLRLRKRAWEKKCRCKFADMAHMIWDKGHDIDVIMVGEHKFLLLGDLQRTVLTTTKASEDPLHFIQCFFCAQKFTLSKFKIVATPPQTDLPDLEHNHPPRQGAERAAEGMTTKELAKERAQDTAIILAHQRLHANAAEWNRAGGASRALTAAKLSTNWRDSSLQRPPISRATTTRRHLSTRRSSEYLRSLPSCRRHRPSWPLLAALRCSPPPIGHRSTKGDLSRAPLWPNHRSRTQQGPCCGVALYRTVAPASRHTLARVRSGARARVLSLPHRLHATPHSQRTSVTCRGNLTLSKMMVRKSPASIRNSGFEGHPHNTSEAPGPECERKWACSPPGRTTRTTREKTCVCHSEMLPRPRVALGSVPCVCLHPQQSTLDGRRRHLTHSCTGPTGSLRVGLGGGPNCPQSPPRRNCPQLCHRRCNHPRQEKKGPHADPCTCGVCVKGLGAMPPQS